MMINDDDCDIEPLRETDFEQGEDEKPPFGAGHCIEMTKLAAMSMHSALLLKANWADLNSRSSSSSRPRRAKEQRPDRLLEND